jgi:hypothetical protein
MVAANYEMRTSVISANNSVPYSLPGTGHAHAEGKNGESYIVSEVREDITITLHTDRECDITLLCNAFNGV